jgi:thiamine-phosphate diphosphorylase
MAAEAAGAHFITCGPVFDTPSKRPFGPPLGLRVLRETAEAVRVPVIAIGGIHAGNVGQVAALPIAGVAMISAVITAPDMMSAVARVREAAA